MTEPKRKWFPSNRWLLLPPILIGIAVIAAFAASRKELVRVPKSEYATPIRVIRAERKEIKPQATGFGTAAPRRVWTAVTEVSGTIQETHRSLRSGNHVEAGEMLIRLDPTDYELTVRQYQADLENAEAQLAERRAAEATDKLSLEIEQNLLAVTEKDYRRLDRLLDSSAASNSEVERARGDLLRQTQSVQKLRNSIALSPSRIAAAKASVSLANARLAAARRDLERTKIVAPFSGVLAGVNVEVGQVVALGARLFEVHDTETIEIPAQFSLSQITPLLMNRGTIDTHRFSAVVTARSGDVEMSWPGKPVRMTPSVDPQTRTLGIVVAVDNTKLSAIQTRDSRSLVRLQPGVFCEVTLAAESTLQSITIPRTALSGRPGQEANHSTVFVVSEDNRLRERAVTTAAAEEGTLTIRSGLREGEVIALQPPIPMLEGMLVKPEWVDADFADSPATDSKIENEVIATVPEPLQPEPLQPEPLQPEPLQPEQAESRNSP